MHLAFHGMERFEMFENCNSRRKCLDPRKVQFSRDLGITEAERNLGRDVKEGFFDVGRLPGNCFRSLTIMKRSTFRIGTSNAEFVRFVERAA